MTNGSLNSYRFSFWLPLFAILLMLIPVFIWSAFMSLAKVTGIAVLILLLVALRKWFATSRLINNRKERIQLSTNDLYSLNQLLPGFKNWSSLDQRILKDQLGLFLAEVYFSGEWTKAEQFNFGIAVSLALWDTGYSNKQHWQACRAPQGQVFLAHAEQTLFNLPQFPMQKGSLKDMLSADSIVAIKKSLLDIL